MHKPFKKTHQNIRGWRRCTIQNSREERGFVFFWHDLTKKVDLKREVQRDNVLFLPFWFYILQYMWWMTNKTRVSSFKVWSRCWSGSLHRPSDRQTVVFGHDTKLSFSQLRLGGSMDLCFLGVFCVFWRKNLSFVAETLLQTFVTLMRMTIWRLIK